MDCKFHVDSKSHALLGVKINSEGDISFLLTLPENPSNIYILKIGTSYLL